MATVLSSPRRPELRERRERLADALACRPGDTRLVRLLADVDAALACSGEGVHGHGQVYDEPVSSGRLLADDFTSLCLDHLSEAKQRELERDLHLASRMQRELLPPDELDAAGWRVSCHWEPAGSMGGDYVDLILPESEDDGLLFMFGDVSGKGISAGIVMAHLRATFHSIAGNQEPIGRLVGRVNRVFRKSSLSPFYATLVCGRAWPNGELEVCNAGHCPPLIVGRGTAREVLATGLPVGMFGSADYACSRLSLAPEETVLLYTDGLTEARNRDNQEYGQQRLVRLAHGLGVLQSREIVGACLRDLSSHRGDAAPSDDLTIMALSRPGPQQRMAA